MGGVDALIRAAVSSPAGVDSSSKVALYSLGTVSSYECCQQVIVQKGAGLCVRERARASARLYDE
jgi:hypothetical protein